MSNFILFPGRKRRKMKQGFMSLPGDGLIILPIFQNINRDPPGTKNGTSKDILCEYCYQEKLV